MAPDASPPSGVSHGLIPLARPEIGDAEIAAVARVLRSGWLTQGREVAAFEAEFANFVGAGHAIAASNGSAALLLALRVLGLEPGAEVITVSHSFIATADAVREAGAFPVFVDIEPATGNMDPAKLEVAITARTRAILCVHQLGMPCDLVQILAIARRHGIPVVEDAACAAGSEVRLDAHWERIGKPHGTIACFSFHPRKLLTTGEGGMVTTADAEIARKIRLLRNHGMSASALSRHEAPEVVFERYDTPGFNHRMTDIAAAVGRVQLARLPDIVARRRALACRYHALLAGIPGLATPTEPGWARSNWQSYGVRLPDGLDQRETMQRLLDLGVVTRRGVMCAHREAAFPSDSWRSAGTLAKSERAQDTSILVPLFAQMTVDDQDRVVAALVSVCARCP